MQTLPSGSVFFFAKALLSNFSLIHILVLSGARISWARLDIDGFRPMIMFLKMREVMRVADFNRPPTKDEVQYMGDLIHGRRRFDLLVMAILTALGAAMGVAIGLSSAATNGEPIDVGFTLACAGVVALVFLVVTWLMLSSIRTIIAICKSWVPARVVVGIVCIVLLVRASRSIAFWMLDPSSIVMHLVMGCMGLIFVILFLMLGLRLMFLVYCIATGKDDEEITAHAISADSHGACRKRNRD